MNGGFPANRPQSKKGPAVKPQLLVCYLCGQQFGSSSLGIHVPQCYDKKVKQWDAGHPDTRGKKPRHPDTVNWQVSSSMTKEDHADQQFKEFAENLEQCGNCGRKFLPDRLVVHQRSCKGGGVGSKPVPGGARPGTNSGGGGGGGGRPGTNGGGPRPASKGPAFKPQLLVCYLCGQQFGSSSLGIHVPQCYDKKTKQWHAGDPETRGKQPRHPDTVNWQVSASLSKEDHADQQFKEFSENLEPCGNCGRKFLPDRLVVHLRSCKGGGVGSKPIASRNPAPSSNTQRDESPSRVRTAVTGRQSPQNGRVGGGGGGGGGGAPSPSRLTESLPARNNNSSGSAPTPKKLPPKLRALQKLLFDDGDLNRDGKIDIDELRTMVAGVMGDDSEQDVQDLMNSLDVNGDGHIDRREWARLAAQTGESANPLHNRLPGGKAPQGRNCNSCSCVEYDANAKFCRECGNTFDTSSLPTCPACNESCPPGSRFCPTCGGGMDVEGAGKEEQAHEEGNETCPSCDAEVEGGGNFCDNCGCRLGLAPAAPASPVSRGGGGGGSKKAMECAECGELYDDLEAKFCEECGCELQEITIKAPPPTQSTPPRPAGGAKNPRTWQDEKLDSTLPGFNKSTLPPDAQSMLKKTGAGGIAPGKTVSLTPSRGQQQQSPTSTVRPAVHQQQQQYDDDDDDDYNGGGGGGSSGYRVPDDPDAYDDGGDRIPCNVCGRRFAPEALDKHENVCRRQKTKPKKVFDSRKARMEGTEAASFKTKVDRDLQSSTVKKKTDWKKQSEDFRNTLRQARKVDAVLKAGGTAKDLPPPVYSENSHYTPCPYCGRKFAPDVAERHIPKCAGTANKPKPPPRRR